jgi:lysozyme family protein
VTPFKRALEFALHWEGGISNHSADAGGLTAYGVTQATYDSYRDRKGLPRRTVTSSTEDEREDLYFSLFWQPAGCFQLLGGVALAQFDFAVNAGPRRAVELLQAVVRAKVDGVLGPKTMMAVAQHGASLARDLVIARKGYYVARVSDRPANAAFLAGWLNRCDALLAEIGV